MSSSSGLSTPCKRPWFELDKRIVKRTFIVRKIRWHNGIHSQFFNKNFSNKAKHKIIAINQILRSASINCRPSLKVAVALLEWQWAVPVYKAREIAREHDGDGSAICSQTLVYSKIIRTDYFLCVGSEETKWGERPTNRISMDRIWETLKLKHGDYVFRIIHLPFLKQVRDYEIANQCSVIAEQWQKCKWACK